MTEFLLIVGSFASIWLVLWFFSALFLLLIYPLLSNRLFNLHPATASRILLILIAFPFFFSLSTTVMLFLPITEGNLVSAHCHESCQAHVPIISSVWLGGIGLLVVLVMLGMLLRKLLFNIRTAQHLMLHLQSLGKDAGNWYQLADPQPAVFTLGWWRNRIFITDGLLQQCDTKDINIILHHEVAHAKRFDNVCLLLARTFLLVLPAGFSGRFYEDLHFFTESACDFAAAEQYGTLDVAETLLKVQKLAPKEFSYSSNNLVCAFTGSEVEQRIKNLLAGYQHFNNPRYSQAICLVTLTLLSIFLVDPMHHSIEWLLALH